MFSRGPSFFFFFLGEGGGVGIFCCCSHYVPSKFPMSSKHIHQVPNISSLYSIPFALSFTLEIYINNPKEDITTYLF
jgi:hypothetical protein